MGRLVAIMLLAAMLLLIVDHFEARVFYTWGPPGQHGTWSAERGRWRASTYRPDVPVHRAVFGCDGGYLMLMLNDLTPVHAADRLHQFSLLNSLDGYYVERYDHDAPSPGTGRIQVRRRWVAARVTHLVALLCTLPALRLVRRWRRRSPLVRRAVEWTLILGPGLAIGMLWRASCFPASDAAGMHTTECFSLWYTGDSPMRGWQLQPLYGQVGICVFKVVSTPTPAAQGGTISEGEWYGFAYEIVDAGPSAAAMADGSARPLGARRWTTLWAPHWALLVLALIPLVRLRHCPAAIRAYLWARRGCCRGCGYDLTANVSGTCPECGSRVAHRQTTVG